MAATSTMSTASAAALAAAISSKPLPSPLPTPESAGFPSALSPLPSAGFPKSAKTPLTPPAAYLDFLRIVDKGLKTPLSSSKSTSFPTSYPSELKSPYTWPRQPQSARVMSTSLDHADSNMSNSSEETQKLATDTSSPVRQTARRASDPPSAVTAEPGRASSAGAMPLPPPPKRPLVTRRPSVIIPESPSSQSPSLMSPASIAASQPNSANPSSASTGSRNRSPASASAAKKYYMSLSPGPNGSGMTANANTNGDGTPLTSTSAYTPSSAIPHGSGVKRPFSVRHVITRTVTYTRPAGTTASIGPVQLSETPADEKNGETAKGSSPSSKSDTSQGRGSGRSHSYDPVRDSMSEEREGEGDGEDGAEPGAEAEVIKKEIQTDTDMDITDIESGGTELGQKQAEKNGQLQAQRPQQHKVPSRERIPLKVESNIAPAQGVTQEKWAIPRTPLVGDVPIGKRRKVG